MNKSTNSNNYEYDISIVIVNYNVKDFLFNCLKSIQNSSSSLKIQTIVVDNDSKDGSINYLKPIFPEVKFIESDTNLGFGKANNIGFKSTKGKYILILNPDTILSSDTLEIMFEFMEQNPKTGISGCKVLNNDGTFQSTCRRGYPTPWASFCKLFGLQAMFPKSKLFSQYNQTFRNIDETYNIDAVIGAFMFCRADVVKELNGFDEDFFMYGEDLDFCYRAQKLGYFVTYVHKTTIIHYKGESTKRSNINDLFHFYNAMEIFVKKHYSSSFLFLLLLKLGISTRGIFAKIAKFKIDLKFILFDLLVLNTTLLIGTKLRFGKYFGFPDYAYPTVFIVISLVLIISLISVGEYFENKQNISKYSFGLLSTFFILSILMYFFNTYAFSRGILLFIIGMTLTLGSLLRILINLKSKFFNKNIIRRILVVGVGELADKIISNLIENSNDNILILGKVNVELSDVSTGNLPVLGNINQLNKLIIENDINEIILSDERLNHSDLISIIQSNSQFVKFHFANDFNELIVSSIINEIIGNDFTKTKYKLNYFRYIVFKRIFDILGSTILILLNLPFALFSNKFKKNINKFAKVFLGDLSIIGLYPTEKIGNNEKVGLIGLAHISKGKNLTEKVIERLNNYYLENYSISLDFEIIIKYLIRK